jgi:P27 family predicted phage terminase small subunit
MSDMPTPRKPTELKAIEGNRGKRSLNRNEPQPDFLNELAPPAWLPADAAAVWSELAFRLRATKVLTVLDVPAFETTCVAIATYRRATRAVAGFELIEKDADAREPRDGKKKRPIGFGVGAEPGAAEVPNVADVENKPAVPATGSQLNPWLIVQSMAFKQATAMLREFGMTPAARSRVLIDPQLGLFGGGNGSGKEDKGSTYFT